MLMVRRFVGGWADVRDLIVLSVEARFGSGPVEHTVEWLSDNVLPERSS